MADLTLEEADRCELCGDMLRDPAFCCKEQKERNRHKWTKTLLDTVYHRINELWEGMNGNH